MDGQKQSAGWVRRLWLAYAALGMALVACSGQPPPESLGVASQALSSTQERILGFESVGAGSTDWTTNSGSLSQSTRHVDGSGSLAISNGGNAEINSAALSSLGPVADKLTLDILLPAVQPNPWWMGTVKLVIVCESQQLWYEGLAEYQLQGKPTEQFLRFEFPLSAGTRTKLSSATYSDLRFKILLNVSPGAGPWLLDRLWVTEASGPAGGGTGGAGGAASGGTAGTSTAGQSGSGPSSGANAAILGFEDPTLWSTSAGALTASDTHVEGSRSLLATGVTYAEITSTPLSTLGSVSSIIGFDLSVPDPSGDVWWWGSAAISLDCPSRGIYNRWLGQQELNGARLNSFRRIEVRLPDDVKATLSSGSYTDLRVKVILTVPQGSGPYLLDRFTFQPQLADPAPPAPSEAVTKALGMETLEAWKASSGVLSLSSNASRGQSSLAVAGFAYTELTTTRLSSLGGQIASEVEFDLWIPTPPNPWWTGSAAVSIHLPSQGIYWRWLGQIELQTVTKGAWQRIRIPLTAEVIQSLKGSYSDLQLKLVLNRGEQAVPWLVDNIQMGQAGSVVATSGLDYLVPLPRGMSFDDVVVGQALLRRADTDVGAGEIVLLGEAGARVVAPRSGWRLGSVSLSAFSRSRDVAAHWDLTAEQNAIVEGSLQAGHSLQLDPTATVAGTATAGVDLEAFEAGRIRVNFPSFNGAPDVTVAANGSADLAPGTYKLVSSANAGTLKLRSGTYYLDQLTMPASSKLAIDNTSGPVLVHVRSPSFSGGGTTTYLDGSKYNVLFTVGVGESSPRPPGAGGELRLGVRPVSTRDTVQLYPGFKGTVVAPRASVELIGGAAAIEGSFFGGSVVADGAITHRPFKRDDCAAQGCGTFGCDTADADADGLYDCQEGSDNDAWTDPNIFNGVHATAFPSCQTASCADLDTLAEADACTASQPADQSQSLYSGWKLGDAAFRAFGCSDELDFWPPWTTCGTILAHCPSGVSGPCETVWPTFAINYQGAINLKTSGKHCFKVSSTGNACGSLFVNNVQSGVTSATDAQCFELPAGVYPIRWLLDAPQIAANNSFLVAYCSGGASACTPTAAIPQSMLRPDNGGSVGCASDAECGEFQYCSGAGACADQGAEGGICSSDAACLRGLHCRFGVGPAYGHERGTSACVEPTCAIDPYEAGCYPEGARCPCENVVRCTSTADCPGQEECVSDGGMAFELPGVDVCKPTGCPSEHCGDPISLCGECECTPTCSAKACGDKRDDGCGGECRGLCGGRVVGCNDDTDCIDGYACLRGGAPRVGGPVGGNVCLPRQCLTPNAAAQACGTLEEPCGLCPEVDESSVCAGRECGRDPSYGVVCGPLDVPCIQGNVVSAFQTTSLNLDTAEREDSPRRTIEPLLVDEPEALEAPGAVVGTFRVDAHGSATYRIPITGPPGRAGMEPELSLDYNSKSGNGIAGFGWVVGGQSSIARCPKTSGTDGWASPVNFEEDDALCLDGQRLVWISGSASPGTAGADYRTEIDSFRKVRLLGATDGGLYFEVYEKSGRILEYGTTDNSRLKRDLPPFQRVTTKAWALAKIRDRIGNYISFEYGKIDNSEARTKDNSSYDTVEFFPSSVAYGGIESPRGNEDHSRLITFEYDDFRHDYMEGYSSSGSRINRTKRLAAIRTWISDTEIRAYELKYRYAPTGLPEPVLRGIGIGPTGPSRVESISECSKKNGNRVCKRPTLFTYTDERGFLPNTSKFDFVPAGSKGTLIALDFDGDGKKDFATTRYVFPGHAQWIIKLNTGDRLNPSFGEILTGVWSRTGDNSNGEEAPCFSQASVADTNGDGRDAPRANVT